MKINKKLLAIASLVQKGENVIDIGCDHALLDIFLTLYNDNHCIASDIKKSAITGAKKNIEKYHLEHKITLSISDGFHKITPRENEVVIISGMGTSTILKILENAPFEKISRFIISSNNDLEKLRYHMMKKNFKVKEEVVVLENDIYYVIIEFEKGSVNYQEKELRYGPILLKQNSVERNSYYRYLLSKEITIFQKLPSKNIRQKYELMKSIFFLRRQIKDDYKKKVGPFE